MKAFGKVVSLFAGCFAVSTTSLAGCGSNDGVLSGASGADAGGLAFTGNAGSGGALGFTAGGASGAKPGGSSAGGAAGTTAGVGGAATCSGTSCAIAPNPAGKAANEPCTLPSQCQTGRCEPAVTGTAGEVCLGACFADGAPCTRALDCCSTGCHAGKCGSLCTLEGDACGTNADCCSNICTQGRCAIDHANRDCRPTGEDCTSGEGSGCCNQCDDATGRCAFGPGTCFAQGVSCTSSPDCCNNSCIAGVCKTPCAATGAACAVAGDCCTSQCSPAGQCVPKTVNPPAGAGGASGAGGALGAGGAVAPPSACTLTGDRCVAPADCCSGVCLGGFCDRAPA